MPFWNFPTAPNFFAPLAFWPHNCLFQDENGSLRNKRAPAISIKLQRFKQRYATGAATDRHADDDNTFTYTKTDAENKIANTHASRYRRLHRAKRRPSVIIYGRAKTESESRRGTRAGRWGNENSPWTRRGFFSGRSERRDGQRSGWEIHGRKEESCTPSERSASRFVSESGGVIDGVPRSTSDGTQPGAEEVCKLCHPLVPASAPGEWTTSPHGRSSEDGVRERRESEVSTKPRSDLIFA